MAKELQVAQVDEETDDDATKAKTQLGWEHSVSFKELVNIMATADWSLVTKNEQVYY